MDKPIRIFYSELSRCFYASKHYKIKNVGNKEIITITGKKYDVTNDIGRAIVENEIVFHARQEAI